MTTIHAQEQNVLAEYHRQRRMFCIYKGNLIIAAPNNPQSHKEWFESEGFISSEDDNLILAGTRGVMTHEKELYFYTGYNFEVTSVVEEEFFAHLKELAEKLALPSETLIYGGALKSAPGTKWPARKSYGCVSDYVSLVEEQ